MFKFKLKDSILMVRVLSTKEFDAWERLLPKDYQEQIQGFIKELKQNYDTGKPLGYPFFREKKMGKYRPIFLFMEMLTLFYWLQSAIRKPSKI